MGRDLPGGSSSSSCVYPSFVCTRWHSQPPARYNHRRTTRGVTLAQIRRSCLYFCKRQVGSLVPSLVLASSPRNPVKRVWGIPVIALPSAPPSRGDYPRPTLRRTAVTNLRYKSRAGSAVILYNQIPNRRSRSFSRNPREGWQLHCDCEGL